MALCKYMQMSPGYYGFAVQYTYTHPDLTQCLMVFPTHPGWLEQGAYNK